MNMDASQVRGLLRMQENANRIGVLPGQPDMQARHSNPSFSNITSQSVLSTDQEKVETTQQKSGRRPKARSPGGSIKAENKGDVELLLLHTKVQEQFAGHLTTLLNDPSAVDLQCCVTYGKPCGCIRKYVLAGAHWKDNSFPNLRVNLMKDKDDNAIAATDRAAMTQTQVVRAKELLDILHRASELKKEKCYVMSEGADGKPLKELRGMIGLGNGRKRSKKYEDYVLEKRGKLREEYALCEKAAQKLLGYSINFLYKKLRTNPQKTSRLVATNKAERASKVPRHLISLQQLQEMANNQQSASQCCCRNCISWLVKQHFDKIVDWRRRLEGSGQRVAQEIVAEVLLVSASLDGQNSFCQNLVHWVTGCSFKKIRRVRDHLKKDPKSLPEHGLKKYWKDKARNQAKGRSAYNKPVTKTEKESDLYIGAAQMERFPAQYDSRMSARGDQITNLNNSNNRFDNRTQFVPATSPNPPPNQTVTNTGLMPMFSGALHNSTAYSRESGSIYQQLQRPVQLEQGPSQMMYGSSLQQSQTNSGAISAPGMNSGASNFAAQSNIAQSFNRSSQALTSSRGNFPEGQNPAYNNQMNQQNFNSKTISSGADHRSEGVTRPQRSSTIIPSQHAEHGSVQYQQQQVAQQNAYSQSGLSKEDQTKLYPAPFIAGFADPNANTEGGQPSYYFAANPANPQQDGFFHTGMTPLFLAQAQQPDGNQADQDGNLPSQFTGQSFFLLSPALPNNTDKQSGFNPGNIENWKQMMMPMTPIQMYPASYFQNGMQNEGGDDKTVQPWGTDAQHFMFPVSDPNIELNVGSDQQDANYLSQAAADNKRQPALIQSGQQQTYLQPALTPLAVMQPQGNNFFSNVGWFATQPTVPAQQPSSTEQPKKSEANAPQYVATGEANQVKYFGGELPQISQFIGKDGQYFDGEKGQQLPMMSQWAPTNRSQGFPETQTTTNQWIASQSEAESHKTQFTQQTTATQREVNPATQSQVPSKPVGISKMPPLAPIQGMDVKFTDSGHGNDQPLKEPTHVDSVNTEGGSSPKGASISDRSKRFSRDRLRATIDSPCLVPPMTPLTPSLTPSIISKAVPVDSNLPESSKEGDLSETVSTSQPLDSSSVFRFPPAHVSRRWAALRMQGPSTADSSKGSKDKQSGEKDVEEAASLEDGGVEMTGDKTADPPSASESLASKEPSGSSRQDSVSSKNISSSVGSCGSLGYISESFLQNDNPILVEFNNVKSLPILSLPSNQWPDDNVTAKSSEAGSSTEQQLQTPTQVLNTPTHQLTPSVTQLQTPTHQLHTPNQTLNTPTQPLNTPTQPLNTPTELTSPTHSSILPPSEEESPVKVLMPAPAGKKRKSENTDATDVDKASSQKQIRFHSFTPKDFESGKVNVSAFRKPSEFASGTGAANESSIAKRRRKPRKQTNPQAHGPVIEIHDDDDDKSDASVEEENADTTNPEVLESSEKDANSVPAAKKVQDIPANPDALFVPNTMPVQPLKTPAVLQRVTPMFIPSSSKDDSVPSSTTQNQLNTPVFLHSGTLNSALLRRASPKASNASSRISSSTPQFFTFMSSPGFPTPLFFTPTEPPADTKNKSAKSKSTDYNLEATDDKSKRSPLKRSHMTLNFSNKQFPDEALQTPSKIHVVTPSAALSSAGVTSEGQQIFCFHDVAPHGKPMLTSNNEKASTSISETHQKEIKVSKNVSAESSSSSRLVDQESKDDEAKPAQPRSKFRPPSLVVDPPSDNEDEDAAPSSTKSNKKEEERVIKNTKTSPASKRPTLHRARSGGKTDLVLSLSNTNSPNENEVSEQQVAPSPLNTPSGIQVITPTMATMLSASKLTSPIQRYPTGMRVRPQSLMMTPICLTPGSTSTTQVATPTLFHIISPSQVAPPSPSVLMYPFPPRGYIKGGTSLPNASSPAFGIMQRAPGPSGSNNSASLLKSALMKTLPVFQFPPTQTTTPTSEASSSTEKDVENSDEARLKPLESRKRLSSAPDYCGESEASSSADDGRPSSAGGLTDKLSGANDPCLSEAAQ